MSLKHTAKSIKLVDARASCAVRLPAGAPWQEVYGATCIDVYKKGAIVNI